MTWRASNRNEAGGDFNADAPQAGPALDRPRMAPGMRRPQKSPADAESVRVRVQVDPATVAAELVPVASLFKDAHVRSRRLGQRVVRSLAEARSNVLFGDQRGIKRPLIALTTKKEMGPVRHALSQMVVAGVMTVHPPMRPGAEPAKAAEVSAPRVFTFTPPPLPEDVPEDTVPFPGTPAPQEKRTTGLPPSGAPASRSPSPAASPASRPFGPVVTTERKVVFSFDDPFDPTDHED
jgi:hypothetical protein